MTPWPVRIIKVGGSLLTFHLLPRRLMVWLKRQSPAHNILIAGGGAFADAIRDADRRFALGAEVSHAICLNVMRVTATLLQTWLTETPISVTRGLDVLQEQLSASISSPSTIVFDAGEFMQHDEAQFPPSPLPHSWEVTSDSIAARVAMLLGAEELVLLKSATPAVFSRQAASETGFVDAYFSRASIGIPIVRVVNLRSTALEEIVLRV